MLNERPPAAIHARPTLLSRLARGAAGLAVAALGLTGCADTLPGDPPGPRLCDAQRCPDGGCRLKARMVASCSDVGAVEVLLDGGLEPELLRGEVEWTSTGQIPVGEAVLARFQADERSWSVEVSCPEDEPARGATLILTCDDGDGVFVQNSAPGRPSTP